MTVYNNESDIYSRTAETIANTSTVSEWVDAFNNNALQNNEFVYYMGETLFNGFLYTGEETVGEQPIASLTNVILTGISPDNLSLDNFYLYFRDINKIILLDQKTFDLTDYADGEPHLFYINSSLGFRVSQKYDDRDDEICLFRFVINNNLQFVQLYITAQRFGTNVYDGSGEYFSIQGLVPKPKENLELYLGDGHIKRSGIKFDNHLSPDLFTVDNDTTSYHIRYNNANNKIDYSLQWVTQVDTTKILNYSTNEFTTLVDGFTAQRILYDVYADELIIQYGDARYDTMQEVISSIDNVGYSFPYADERPMYIPLAVMFIQVGADDITDTTQCMIVQQTNITVSPEASLYFAEDAYARGRLGVIEDSLADFNTRITTNTNDITNLKTRVQTNTNNISTLSGNIQTLQTNLSTNYYNKTDSDTRYVNVTGDTMTGNLTLPVVNAQQYVQIGTGRLYIGVRPNDAPIGSYSITVE